jgi:hypothetical protein
MQGRPRAQVVGLALHLLQEIWIEQAHTANGREDGQSQNDRRTLKRFEFHRIGLNEKPEQLKAALVN